MDILWIWIQQRCAQSTPTMANVGPLGVSLAVLCAMIDMSACCVSDFEIGGSGSETCVTGRHLESVPLEPTLK